MSTAPRSWPIAASLFLLSFSLVLFELVLTRLFGVILFAASAHLALALAMLGISAGAVAQHMWPWLVPEKRLHERLALLSLAAGGAAILAVWATVTFPLVIQFVEPPENFGERSSIAWDLINGFWFANLLPFLALPFGVVGVVFAGVFQRRKDQIGFLYGADLLGGAAGALAFLPLLRTFSAPDCVFVVVLATLASAVVLLWAERRDRAAGICGAIALVLCSLLMAASQGELIRIRYAAGYSEANVTYTQWTPLTRLAVHEDERGTFMLLDNTSASEVVLTEQTRQRLTKAAARAFVYRFHDPPARVAILAASAGPEVAVAQALGYRNITAVDIAAEIGDLVHERWPDSPTNPYRVGHTRRVWADGRAAILHSERPFDIIQMVHANLYSSAGLLSNAWSPNLLETKQAFHTYLDKLTADGTLSFSASSYTSSFARTAAEALEERGAKRPGDHMAYVSGNQTFLLVKKRPFTQEERTKLVRLVDAWGGQKIVLDPLDRDLGMRRMMLQRGRAMTDDRPFFESPEQFRESIGKVVRRALGDETLEAAPIDVVYNNLVLQAFFVVVAGSLLVLLPLARLGPIGLSDTSNVWLGLLYASCIGYGYLAVETVLIHELVIFVGHPTYAVTLVVFTMLLSSGIGSILAGRVPDKSVPDALRMVLGSVLALGVLQAWVVPGLLSLFALGFSMEVRMALTGAALVPIGLAMGAPFPLFMRSLRPEASGIVPWAWGFNGWTSVVASVGTIFLSRTWGYSAAFVVALLAYGAAFALAPHLHRIGASKP
jgi:hypothetical protein